MTFSKQHRQFMRRAIELAERGAGCVEPNPMVGCVIVDQDRTIGEGWHRNFGGAHAEVDALSRVGEADLSTAIMYVTLEPCCHTGKTPPCTDAIKASGIGRVVIASSDPFPEVAGKGIQQLLDAGIPVEKGCEEEAANELIRPYLKRVQTGMPWVIAKWAMTLDGKIASDSGDSQWISNELSRQVVHQLRGRVDAIIVGRGTAQRDDPLLTARPPGPRTATRIVVDRYARLPLDSQLVRTSAETPVVVVINPQAAGFADAGARADQLVAAGCEVLEVGATDNDSMITSLLRELGKRDYTNVMVEGGGALLGSFMSAGQIDEVHAFVAPKLLGGADAISPVAGVGFQRVADAMQISSLDIQQLGTDVYLKGRRVIAKT